MDKQSTRIGVDMLYVAKITAETTSSITYDTSQNIPGVRSIGLTINGDIFEIDADDGIYEAVQEQASVDGSMPLIGLDAETYAAITGATYSATNGVVEDYVNDNPSYYAVGFRALKADGSYEFVWLPKVMFGKPNMAYQNKGAGVTPNAPEYMFKTIDRYDQKWRRRVMSDDTNLPSGNTVATLSSAVDGWFSDPDFVPVVIP